MTTRILRWCGTLLCVALTACGFHLRGEGPGGASSFPFRHLYVATGAGGIGDIVTRQLGLQHGIEIVPAAASDAILSVQPEQQQRQVLAVNNAGFVAEYLLVLRVRFQLQLGGKTWIPLTQITLHRDFPFNSNNPLGSDAEANLLYNDMRLDAAQQIIRRLAAARGPNSNAASAAKQDNAN